MGASDWGSVKGAGEICLGGWGGCGVEFMCVTEPERLKGRGSKRLSECSVCVNVSACSWMRNGQWIE